MIGGGHAQCTYVWQYPHAGASSICVFTYVRAILLKSRRCPAHVHIFLASRVCFRRRKTREAKQYSKQVQAEKQKERNASKKKQIESVTNMRKQREKSVGLCTTVFARRRVTSLDEFALYFAIVCHQETPRGWPTRA